MSKTVIGIGVFCLVVVIGSWLKFRGSSVDSTLDHSSYLPVLSQSRSNEKDCPQEDSAGTDTNCNSESIKNDVSNLEIRGEKMPNTVSSPTVIENYIQEHFADSIKQVARVDGESIAFTLNMVSGPSASQHDAESLGEKLTTSFEKAIKESLVAQYEKVFTSEELKQLLDLHKNSNVDLLRDARLQYQAQLADGKDDKAEEGQHKTLIMRELSPQRAELLSKIDSQLGESEATYKRAMLTAQVSQGKNSNVNIDEIDPAKLAQFKNFTLKMAGAYYHSLGDKELSEYSQLLEKTPLLIKEERAIQQAQVDATEKVIRELVRAND